MSNRDGYIEYVNKSNKEGSQKANSYIRALDILCKLLKYDSKGFNDCVHVWSVESIDRVKKLKEFVLIEQRDKESSWLIDGIAPSYLVKGHCAAALAVYIDFLNERGNVSVGCIRKKYLTKPFILLAGISGTGKTRYVREQASATGSLEETYKLVSVRPDWHEPSDLLGYESSLNGKEYKSTDFLLFLVKAWIECHAGIGGGADNGVKGDAKDIENVRPYWVCLDEMNLAPVEQYFADYLSVMETRRWGWDNESFTYTCDALLSADLLKRYEEQAIRTSLGIEASDHDTLWAYFLANGVGIPFNLIVAGTVNMDETTHGFSRKVIDRALTFDFGAFFPNEFDDYFTPKTTPVSLSYPLISDARESVDEGDENVESSIQFLKSVNEVLDGTAFELAYRALNELLLSVAIHEPGNELALQAVWDDFLMCKVLPRIEGDREKLAYQDSESILEQLQDMLGTKYLKSIWDDEERPDLYQKKVDGGEHKVACRSRSKLEMMVAKLSRGFTSYWP